VFGDILENTVENELSPRNTLADRGAFHRDKGFRSIRVMCGTLDYFHHA
jgi:hypothetical protein